MKFGPHAMAHLYVYIKSYIALQGDILRQDQTRFRNVVQYGLLEQLRLLVMRAQIA
jgi:hypothetical protein